MAYVRVNMHYLETPIALEFEPLRSFMTYINQSKNAFIIH